MKTPLFDCLISLTFLAAPVFAESREQVTLARDGEAACVVVQADNATEPEKFAAKELATFLKRVTGAEFPVVAEPSLTGDRASRIYVGWTGYAARHGIDASKLGEEEWVIRTVGDDLVLTGGRPRGTMYAISHNRRNTVAGVFDYAHCRGSTCKVCRGGGEGALGNLASVYRQKRRDARLHGP